MAESSVSQKASTLTPLTMNFPERLATLRKTRGLTQNALADAVQLHVSQIRRYEAGTAQPTLEVIRRLATTLHVTSDLLIFDTDERGPDDDLRLAFEATNNLDATDKAHIQALLEGILLRHQAQKITQAR